VLFRSGTPDWAQLELGVGRPGELAAAYAALLAAGELALAAARRRRGLGPGAGRRLPPRVALAALGVAAASALAPALVPGPGGGGSPPSHLQVRALDVGQGDAILLDPPGGEPVLVDAGPPGSGLPSRLRDLGVDSLGAVVITHDQSDHAGGLAELLRALPVRRIALGAASPRLRELARGAGVETVALAEGGELVSGELRLTALWPPRALAGTPAEDPNTRSLVLVAEWRHFSALLTGDAEAEAVPLDPGPVDMLKVAHHGSADDGLEGLLERTAPKLALISVGENGYGHPSPETLSTLERHGVPVMRTDRSGAIAIEAGASGWSVVAGG
jgi:competence protein ComEC